MDRAPVLVLGVGNLLLADDAVGLELLAGLRRAYGKDERVELVDGGTQGLALLGVLAGREALLLLDAVALGGAPGALHVIADVAERPPPKGRGAHEGSAGGLLAAARLTGDLPREVELVGVEPSELATRIGLSAPVRAALPLALRVARVRLERMLARLEEAAPCTS